MRATGWVVLCVLLLLAACAGPSAQMRPSGRTLGDGRPLLASLGGVDGDADPDGDDGPLPEQAEPQGPALGVVTARQRQSESLLAIAQLWRALGPEDQVGTRVELGYWNHNGALTPVYFKRLAEGRSPPERTDPEALARELRALRDEVTKDEQGDLTLLLVRERDGWRLRSYHFEPRPGALPPPEAKRLAVDAPEILAGPFAALEAEVRTRWLRLLKAPADGRASLEMTMDLQDDWVVGSTPGRYESQGRAASITPPPGFETRVAGALVAFTQGVGRRTVRVQLRAVPAEGEAVPHWEVTSAETVRPTAGERTERFTTAAEYRQLHEEILRRWREGVQEAAMMAAAFTAEQMAWWLVGGWAERGLAGALDLAASPLARMLGRNTPEAAGWIECLLARLPTAEREALSQLLTKVETRGIKALSDAERAQLRARLLHLGELAGKPLNRHEKASIRRIARERLWPYIERRDRTLASRLVDANGNRYEVHHRWMLTLAHLAPEMDINALVNLVAVAKPVHYSIGRIWDVFFEIPSAMTPANIREVISVIDRNYGRWYNAVYDEAIHAAQLQAAEKSAMTELQALLARVGSIK